MSIIIQSKLVLPKDTLFYHSGSCNCHKDSNMEPLVSQSSTHTTYSAIPDFYCLFGKHIYTTVEPKGDYACLEIGINKKK